MSARDFMGRPMPQSPDAERAVLGSILINAGALARVSSILVPDDFLSDAHRAIYTAQLELDNEGCLDLDALIVRDRLRDQGKLEAIGGAAYLAKLTDSVPDVANVERYARIVKRRAQQRAIILAAADAIERAFDGGEKPEELATDTIEALQLVRPADAESVLLSLDDVTARLFDLYEAGGVERGAVTGWPELDRYYTIARGSWTLVTGIPGHGKSNFIDALSLNVADLHGWQVVMFSAENYPPESHIASLIEKHVGKPFNEGPSARMTPDDVRAGMAFVARHFRFINPTAEGMTLDRVLATASALAEAQPIDVLTIDPWNELAHERPEFMSETEYISISLTKVRRWAKRHRAHVFIVAHPRLMQKDRDSGKYQVPTPYDVSGSAHWRNKADQCLCIYRDITAGDDDPAVAIHVQKVRRREHGRIGQVILNYDKVTGEYHDPTQARRHFRDVRRLAAEGRPA